MIKRLYFLVIVSLFAIGMKAQVTIGSKQVPEQGSVLDLKSDTLGFLPPRVNLISPSSSKPLSVHSQGMVVFNLTQSDSLQVGLYYDTNSSWVHLSETPLIKENWFYMPSIPISTVAASYPATGNTVDLYAEFQKQLYGTGPLVTTSKSPATPVLSMIPARTDIDYYVTSCDTTVFGNISITPNGVLSYDLKAVASDSTYMNIVFVEKK